MSETTTSAVRLEAQNATPAPATAADGAAGPEGQPGPAPEEPKPTATLAQCNATLAKFGAECRTAADANYRLADLAARYVAEFLGAAPGKAQRSTAAERLA